MTTLPPPAPAAPTPAEPTPPLRPHLALRHIVLARTLGRPAADAYAASVSTPDDRTHPPAARPAR